MWNIIFSPSWFFKMANLILGEMEVFLHDTDYCLNWLSLVWSVKIFAIYFVPAYNKIIVMYFVLVFGARKLFKFKNLYLHWVGYYKLGRVLYGVTILISCAVIFVACADKIVQNLIEIERSYFKLYYTKDQNINAWALPHTYIDRKMNHFSS